MPDQHGRCGTCAHPGPLRPDGHAWWCVDGVFVLNLAYGPYPDELNRKWRARQQKARRARSDAP